MTDTARDYQTLTTADTNGLEHIFDVVPTPADSLSVNVGTVATDDDNGEWITAAEAASSFKKSERTIQRYAKSGKLRSKTDESGRLMIWSTTPADTHIRPADSVATVADTDGGLPTGADNLATNAENERLWDLLREKDAKIEALLMRNGYLQAQVETTQETIKLLTDSQHKPGWWTKFSSWFFKGQSN
ncbi:MAG: hypothetical protein JSS83_28980 [Cyanobacteria bacterium SZAS LIN-3]|nr:hypothetical protein [Cyanobacteria bacterium SZAS LIN-3]